MLACCSLVEGWGSMQLLPARSFSCHGSELAWVNSLAPFAHMSPYTQLSTLSCSRQLAAL